MFAIVSKETRPCPKEFQDRVTRMFGTNLFGEPNFKIVWGSSEFHKMGSNWTDRFGNDRTGYRMKYFCPGGIACWNILRWKPAQAYGSPDLWYMKTWEPSSQMYILGEYPWKGRYEILQPLYSKEFVNNKLVIDAFPLSHILIDLIIPMMESAQKLTDEERRVVLLANRDAQHQADVAVMAERMMENMPAYVNPVSFTHQGIKTSLLARKEEAIRKQWDRLSRGGKRPSFKRSRGFFRGERPQSN